MTAQLQPKERSLSRLEMRGVSKRFGATRALSHVNLLVRAGEVLALVGENGAGKSTLMKVLSGAHAPNEGQMWLDGEPYHPRRPLDARRAGVAMIYQELSLARHGRIIRGLSTDALRRQLVSLIIHRRTRDEPATAVPGA